MLNPPSPSQQLTWVIDRSTNRHLSGLRTFLAIVGEGGVAWSKHRPLGAQGQPGVLAGGGALREGGPHGVWEGAFENYPAGLGGSPAWRWLGTR